MKTYSRKKVIHHELEGVLDMCRLCLNKSEQGVPIFKDSQDVCAVLSMRIMICVGLEMTYNDFLPNKICMDCLEELEKYYKFRRKCEDSYQKLKGHVHFLKEKEKIICKNIVDDDEDTFKEITKIPLDDDVKQLLVENEAQLDAVPPTHDNGTENSLQNNDNIEENQEPVSLERSPDISTFLRTVFLELGVVVQQGAALALQHRAGCFTLETGAGDLLQLELREEDDDSTPHEYSQETQPQEMETKTELLIEPLGKQNGGRSVKKNAAGAAEGRQWCAQCGRVFASVSSARRHRAQHAAARAHACPRCRRAFTQRAARDRHMLVHLEQRPYKCGECDKSYTQRGALAAHVRAHAVGAGAGAGAGGGRVLALHRCTLCDKVFLYPSGLSRHMSTHAGRSFSCESCTKQFTDRSSLLRHIRTYHQHQHTDGNIKHS